MFTETWDKTCSRTRANFLLLYSAARYESPRVLRRLNTLRGLSHEEDKQVLA